MRMTYIIFALLAFVANESSGARILGLFPFNAKSHSIMTNAIIAELAKRGHQVKLLLLIIGIYSYIILNKLN